jgi:hypothetical protein
VQHIRDLCESPLRGAEAGLFQICSLRGAEGALFHICALGWLRSRAKAAPFQNRVMRQALGGWPDVVQIPNGALPAQIAQGWAIRP